MSQLTLAATNNESLLPPPAGDAMRSQQLRQCQFRVLVAAPANPRHHFRPLRLGENVRHLLRANVQWAGPGYMTCYPCNNLCEFWAAEAFRWDKFGRNASLNSKYVVSVEHQVKNTI